MKKFITYNGPFDESLEFLAENNARPASIPDYIDFSSNNGISNDSYDSFVRTKECFIYVPAVSNIDNLSDVNHNKPGGIWFNTSSPIILDPETAVKMHRMTTKFRLNGLLRGSRTSAINHHPEIIDIPVDSLERYPITQKIFYHKIRKSKSLLKKLDIENIHVEFYDKDKIRKRGYSFADQVIVYLDRNNKQLLINGKSGTLHNDLRTLGVKNNIFRNLIKTLKNPHLPLYL